MAVEFRWCIIVNLNTCPLRLWLKWEFMLAKNQIAFTVHFTKSIRQVKKILSASLSEGTHHFLFAGGDGTLHQCGNILITLAGNRSSDITIGVLPCGTGNDWIRTFRVDKKKLLQSLKTANSVPLHLIKLTWPDGRERYAFNMVGGALDAAVVNTLSGSGLKIPGSIKYPIALLKTLMKPHTWNLSVKADGKNFTGDFLTIQAGFGKYCGGGMYVLPQSEENKAALLLMKPKSLLKLITSLPKLYNGKVAAQKEAIALHFTEIDIDHVSTPMPVEADGEALGYSPVKLIACYNVLQRLAE